MSGFVTRVGLSRDLGEKTSSCADANGKERGEQGDYDDCQHCEIHDLDLSALMGYPVAVRLRVLKTFTAGRAGLTCTYR